jgi:hypothetical protein
LQSMKRKNPRKLLLAVSSINEATIKYHVKKRLKQLGPDCFSHWPVLNGMGGPCLDCHLIYRGKPYAIETKRPGEKPTVRQNDTIERIRSAGGTVIIVDSIEQARDLFIDHIPQE